MNKSRRFDHSKITNSKRLARGEQLLMARTLLRARDEQHNRAWRVMILAGGSPGGEIAAIRELMPKAHITAVDTDRSCLAAAKDAGADEVICCDLADWVTEERTSSWGTRTKSTYLPVAMSAVEPFDIICLDLCGPVNRSTRELWRQYRRKLSRHGIMILTFSYGRDVLEVFEEAKKNAFPATIERFEAWGIPAPLQGRFAYLFTGFGDLNEIRSVIGYRGNEMPMCSVLRHLKKTYCSRGLYVGLEARDWELAVIYPQSMALYDCPSERIAQLRRHFAAIKASCTRKHLKRKPEQVEVYFLVRTPTGEIKREWLGSGRSSDGHLVLNDPPTDKNADTWIGIEYELSGPSITGGSRDDEHEGSKERIGGVDA